MRQKARSQIARRGQQGRRMISSPQHGKRPDLRRLDRLDLPPPTQEKSRLKNGKSAIPRRKVWSGEGRKDRSITHAKMQTQNTVISKKHVSISVEASDLRAEQCSIVKSPQKNTGQVPDAEQTKNKGQIVANPEQAHRILGGANHKLLSQSQKAMHSVEAVLSSYGSVNHDMQKLMGVLQAQQRALPDSVAGAVPSPAVVSTLAQVRNISDQLEKAERAATISHNLILGICQASMAKQV